MNRSGETVSIHGPCVINVWFIRVERVSGDVHCIAWYDLYLHMLDAVGCWTWGAVVVSDVLDVLEHVRRNV